uniref:RdRp catalytic domain-containing protein n=1 Tax=Trichuris muris TaxID=70415 RepID=A0A5S6R5F0_TRIMR
MMKTTRGRDATVHEISAFNHKFLVTRQLCLVFSPTFKASVFVDYDAIFCMFDVIEQRYLCCLSMGMMNASFPDIYYFSWKDLEAVFEWGDFHLRRNGSNGYKVIKMYEPICMAALPERSRCPSLSKDFVD